MLVFYAKNAIQTPYNTFLKKVGKTVVKNLKKKNV